MNTVCDDLIENQRKVLENLNIEKPIDNIFSEAQQQLQEIQENSSLSCVPSAPSAPVLEKSKFETISNANKEEITVPTCPHSTEKESVNLLTVEDVLTMDSAIQPFTERQIHSRYQNYLLEQNDNYIEEFLNDEQNLNQHIFYDKVMKYLGSRRNLLSTQDKLKDLRKDYKNHLKNAWIFEKKIVTEEGECDDDQLLIINHEYEIACFKDEVSSQTSHVSKQIRNNLFEKQSLYLYSCEMSKLQVENYMQNIISSCPTILNLPKESDIQISFQPRDPSLKPHIIEVKKCISILFDFQRRGITDVIFLRDTRQWLSDLIAILLRLACHTDHLFILNHILRCPPGINEWTPSYIQIIPPEDSSNRDVFGSLLLDHAFTVISTLLRPTKNRKHFLHHLSKKTRTSDETENLSNSDLDNSNDSIWVVLDSTGEEEEDENLMWQHLSDSDIIEMLNQIPFEALFKHILQINLSKQEKELSYDVSRVNHSGMLKLFAFASQLINLFQEGLATYKMLRYDGVTKRLSRLIRHTVHYVTDHWRNYVELHKDKTFKYLHGDEAAWWSRLQIEYDQLFEKAVNAIFSSPRSGALQFLAVIPFNFVSLSRLWKITYKLHVGYDQSSLSRSNDWASVLVHPDTRGRFQDLLLKMGENESYYLLTAFANMAIARGKNEKEFIEVVVNNVFEIGFVSESSREICSRNGRDLLATIASQHTFTMSYLLALTQEKISSLGNMALYLFRFLPLELWEPTEDDITCISYWLLFTPTSSLENQLTRVIMERLNWGTKGDGSMLALPRNLHMRVAITIVEAHMKVTRECAQEGILAESVKQVTSVVYPPSPNQVFFQWAWDMLNVLKLHQLDQTTLHVHFVMSSPANLLAGIPDPTSNPSVDILKRGLVEKKPIAMFLSLLSSTWGHSIPEFCQHGLECLEVLVGEGHYEAAISVLSHVSPLFFNQPEEIVSDSKFITSIQSILSADQTYYTMAKNLISNEFPGKILKLFGSMIHNHLSNYKFYGFKNINLAVNYWLQVLINIPHWMRDASALYLMDIICHQAILYPNSWSIVLQVYSEVSKTLEVRRGSVGSITSLVSWMTSGTVAPHSLLVKSSDPELPWFVMAVLTLESQNEIKSGIWKNLLSELYRNPDLSVDAALKKSCEAVKETPFSSNLISLYRWGQQIIDLPFDHEALLPTLQFFLILHLSRVPPGPDEYECSSVISRFYLGLVNGGFLKKIKKKVIDVISFYKKKKCDFENEDLDWDIECNENDLSNFAKDDISNSLMLFSAISDWLEEPRLYETGVYLPAFPPQCLPDKLMTIFQENWDIWPEAILQFQLKKHNSGQLAYWRKLKSRPNSTTSSSPAHRSKKKTVIKKYNHTKEILRRLTEYDPIKKPPPLPPLRLLPPVKERTLIDEESLLYDVDRHTKTLLSHSNSVFLWSQEMCQLDCVHTELLPQLWNNCTTKMVKTISCQPGKNSPNKSCTGPASIVIEVTECRKDAGVCARMDLNREQYQTLYNLAIQPPPLQLCQAVLHLESLITTMIKWYRSLVNDNNQTTKTQSLLSSGRRLFYHLVEMTSEETTFYAPAMQVISSCADVLGSEFLQNHGDCQSALVTQVMQWKDQFGHLVAPHFTPLATDTDTLLGLYSALAPYAVSSPDMAFMLLTKFHVDKWLRDRHPGAAERRELINAIGAALVSNLTQGTSESVVNLELYRVHLRNLLLYRFPEHYNDVVTVILEISACNNDDCYNVSTNIIYDLMNTIAGASNLFHEELSIAQISQLCRQFSQQQTCLSAELVKDTLNRFSHYFVKERLENGLFGLYPKYRLHIKPLASLFGMISYSYITYTVQSSNGSADKAKIKEIWENIEGLWAAWVAPLGGKARTLLPKWLQDLTNNRRLLLPWSPADTINTPSTIAMFVNSLGFLHEMVSMDSLVLSLTLEYYYGTYAKREVKDHVLTIVHSHLANLHWHHFYPTISDIEIFGKIIDEFLPECHSFTGSILVQISWKKIVEASLDETLNLPSNVTRLNPERLHFMLLNILIRISLEPTVRQSGLLQTLLIDAENFGWHFVDGISYEGVLNWLVLSCDPRIILVLKDRNPIDICMIQLLHVSAGYTPEIKHFHADTSIKRGLLVRALVRLITSASTRNKSLLSGKPQAFSQCIKKIMKNMEETLDATVPIEQQWNEGLYLCTEALALVGGGSASPELQQIAKDAVLDWLNDQHSSPALLLPCLGAICRRVLQLHHRNIMLEKSLWALFSLEGANISWQHIIPAVSFPLTNPSAMLTLAAQEGHVLLIFTHTRWRRTTNCDCTENPLILSKLCELLGQITPEEKIEQPLLLMFCEVLDLIRELVSIKC